MKPPGDTRTGCLSGWLPGLPRLIDSAGIADLLAGCQEPVRVSKAPCQERVETDDIDLLRLPVLRATTRDGLGDEVHERHGEQEARGEREHAIERLDTPAATGGNCERTDDVGGGRRKAVRQNGSVHARVSPRRSTVA